MAIQRQKEDNNANTLKNDLKAGSIGTLYIFSGEEDYLKKYYLGELKKSIIDPAFEQFNFVQLEGKELTPENLSEAIESYPAFSQRKMVVVNDFDLFKPPSAFTKVLPDLLSDLPEYICLIFYYDTLLFKPDKRTKMYSLLQQNGVFVHFPYLSERELIAWIRRRVRMLGKEIGPETCSYLVFLCGAALNNLITEIDKAVAHSTLDEIKKYNIDCVCTRTLEAVIFDLTDALTLCNFDQAIEIVNDLLVQKNTETSIFSAVLRHFERLYAVKLGEMSSGTVKQLMTVVGSSSSYYVQKLQRAAKKLSLKWLRNSVMICGQTDAELKSSAANKHNLLELALLSLGAMES